MKRERRGGSTMTTLNRRKM